MNKRIVSALLLLIVLLAGNVATVYAVPPMPASFYGTVLIDGVNAPLGTVIAARINGVEYASTTVVEVGGDSMYAFDVPGEDPDVPGIQGGVPGNTVVFYIGGQIADQTGTWQSGLVELNLSYIPNSLPIAADNQVTILEDTQKVFAAGDFNFSDANPGDVLHQVQITTLESAGSLYLDANNNGSLDSGEDVTLNQVILTADLARLKFLSQANASGSPYASFRFKVHDGKDYSINSYQMTVHVTAVNDAPSFTKGANQTVPEDAGPQSVPAWATNISAGPANESGQVLAFSITANTNPSLFSTPPAVDASTGSLTYTSAANVYGAATITLRLGDDGGTLNGGVDTSAEQTFSITVTPVNDTPVADPQSVTTSEDTTKAITLSGSDLETSISFIVISQPAHGILGGTAPNLTYTPAANYFGPDGFTFKVNDGILDSPTAQVSITVTSVNDAPVCQNLTLLAASTTPTQVAPSCNDVEGNPLTYNIAVLPVNGTASVVGDMLEYTSITPYTGPDSFTYRANDGIANSSPAAVSVTVLASYPTVHSITRVDPSVTDRAKVKFAVTFSSSVTGVSLDDFEVAPMGVTGAAPAVLIGSGSTYTVTVTTGSGDGLLGLNLVDDNSILDALNHTLGGPDPGDGNFIGEVYKVDKTLSFTSQGPYDGWVLESTETSGSGGSLNSSATTLRLGDDTARRQYRSILSFATGASLPDPAVITKVTLKVKRQGVVGVINPVTAFQGFMLDIKKGFFGTSALLQLPDFQAAASRTVGPFTPALSGGWYTIDLTAAKGSINKLLTSGGYTQVRLRFKLDDNNNNIANTLSLYSGNYATPTARPTLIIEYYVP